jgi:membrane peptidoglycan carboxypeptidase
MNQKRRWILALKWATVVGLSFVLFIVAAGFVLYQTISIPSPNAAYQSQTTFVYYADGKNVALQIANQNRTELGYNQMPETIKRAVVAAEDRTFWTNNGIDMKGIIRAMLNNAAGGNTQGASTITQQYVKLLYLNQQRSYTRKIKEAILALKLQQSVSKQDILQGYLNAVYFGRSSYGIEAASMAYFGHHAAKLNIREAAMLASIINNPNYSDPYGGKDQKQFLTNRYDYVLDGLAGQGSITATEAAHFKKMGLPDTKPPSVNRNSLGGQRGFIKDLVEQELVPRGFNPELLESGGLRITTTLDQKAMEAAANGVSQERPDHCYYGAGDECTSDKNLHIGVAMVQPGTGNLLGFYAGQDYVQSQHNWAIVGGMAGSSVKPITLTAALNSGYSLKSTWDGNSPYYYPGATHDRSCIGNGTCVVNEGEEAGEADGHSYGSAITSVKALEQSVNTAFIDMTESIPDGPKTIFETALAMGLPPSTVDGAHPGIPSTTRDLSPDDRRITLGKAIISPINMANVYATIADGGERANVHVVQKVTDSKGTVLYEYKGNTTRAIPQDVADDVSYAMQDVVKQGTGRAALNLGRPAAGKTGTATAGDAKDSWVSSAWFSGFTPQVAVSVMYVRGVGNQRLNQWMPSYFGADYPTRTWTNITRSYLEGQPVEQFPPPANVSGTAPQSGHDYTPPPPPPPRPQPKPKPKPTATPKPTKTPKPTPTATSTASTPPKGGPKSSPSASLTIP